jgi:hypothetical protein
MPVRVSFINKSAHTIYISPFSLHDIIDFSVSDSSGNRLPARVENRKSNSVGGYEEEIKPWRTFSRTFSLKQWVEIKSPGVYRVTVNTKGKVFSQMKKNEASMTITVEEKKDEVK